MLGDPIDESTTVHIQQSTQQGLESMKNVYKGIQRMARLAKVESGTHVERIDILNADTAPLWRSPKSEGLRYGTRTRKGTPCQAAAMSGGKDRCRNHGGGSTGPRTPEWDRADSRIEPAAGESSTADQRECPRVTPQGDSTRLL